MLTYHSASHDVTVLCFLAAKRNEVFVYDSMYLSIGSHTRNQIAALMACKENDIVLQMMDVQLQTGRYDCGLFAIAFATAIAKGILLQDVSYKMP